MTEMFDFDLDTPSLKGSTLRDRFNAKVGERDTNGCLPWTGSTIPCGRGQIHADGKNRFAPRVAYLIANGPFDDSLHILHSCDNPNCVEPSHLRTGTRQENMQDMADRRRNDIVKLTNEQVLEIYRRVWDGEKQYNLAAEFGVDRSTISAIKLGKRWAHITEHKQAA